MDYSIITGDNGVPEMSWDKPENISTLLFNSVSVKKGTLISKPDFGLDLSDIKKVTTININKIKSRIETACKWLIEVGKAKSLNIIVERNPKDLTRINYKIEAIQADGIPVTVSYFQTVGGASDNFTI